MIPGPSSFGIFKEKNMTERTSIGGNNPPEDQKIAQLSNSEEIKLIIASDVSELSQKAEELLSTCKRVPAVVETDEVYDRVVALIAAIRKVESDKEEKRKKHKEPYLAAERVIDSEFKLKSSEGKEQVKDMDAQIKGLTKRLSDYDTKKFEKQRQEAALEAEKIAEKAREDGIEIPAGEIEVKLESRRSEYGGLSTKSVVKDWEIINPEELPRSVLVPDPKKIQELVDKGANIPGIKVTERIETNVKRK